MSLVGCCAIRHVSHDLPSLFSAVDGPEFDAGYVGMGPGSRESGSVSGRVVVLETDIVEVDCLWVLCKGRFDQESAAHYAQVSPLEWYIDFASFAIVPPFVVL